MAQNKYLNYEGLAYFLEKLDDRYSPIKAIIFKSTVNDIASLPALNTVQAGWMYNIKTGGLTTADFVEGAGHIVADGENIAAVELFTGAYTQVATVLPTDDPKLNGWYEIDTPATDVYTLSTDSTVDPTKTYYSYDGTNYTAVTPVGTENPSTEGWYEKSTTPATYKLSQDRLPAAGKDYFTADTEMKWDLMGGVFDLEDRYLEFGDKFPQSPASRMVDGRTFLYMGETVKGYTYVDAPTGRPADNGYFEGTFTQIADTTTIYNPHQQGLYEADAVTAGVYVLSTDKTYDNTKTYYTGAFVASVDQAVDPAKFYYTEEDLYKKAVIYQYDKTANDWVAQSNSGTDDMIAITNKEIDELFI